MYSGFLVWFNFTCAISMSLFSPFRFMNDNQCRLPSQSVVIRAPIQQMKSKTFNLNHSLQTDEISVVRKGQIEVLLSADVCLLFIICNLSMLAKKLTCSRAALKIIHRHVACESFQLIHKKHFVEWNPCKRTISPVKVDFWSYEREIKFWNGSKIIVALLLVLGVWRLPRHYPNL